MKLKNITNRDAIVLIENATELFILDKYKDKKYVEAHLGLAISRVSFYGTIAVDGTVTALDKTNTVFNSSNDVPILVEGILILDQVPINEGLGDIVYYGYGVLEVDGVVIYDGRTESSTGEEGVFSLDKNTDSTVQSNRVYIKNEKLTDLASVGNITYDFKYSTAIPGNTITPGKVGFIFGSQNTYTPSEGGYSFISGRYNEIYGLVSNSNVFGLYNKIYAEEDANGTTQNNIFGRENVIYNTLDIVTGWNNVIGYANRVNYSVNNVYGRSNIVDNMQNVSVFGYNNKITGDGPTFGGQSAFVFGGNIDIRGHNNYISGIFTGWNVIMTGYGNIVVGSNIRSDSPVTESMSLGSYQFIGNNNNVTIGNGVGGTNRLTNNISWNLAMGMRSSIAPFNLGPGNPTNGQNGWGRIAIGGHTDPTARLDIQAGNANIAPFRIRKNASNKSSLLEGELEHDTTGRLAFYNDSRQVIAFLSDLGSYLTEVLPDDLGITLPNRVPLSNSSNGWVSNGAVISTASNPNSIAQRSSTGQLFIADGNSANHAVSLGQLWTELESKADLVDGKVPVSQLPSYVSDVIVVADYASLPAIGEESKIYVTENENKTYRWTGSSYVEIGDGGVALGETSATAYRGDRGKTAYDHSQTSGNPHNTGIDDIEDLREELNDRLTAVTPEDVNITLTSPQFYAVVVQNGAFVEEGIRVENSASAPGSIVRRDGGGRVNFAAGVLASHGVNLSQMNTALEGKADLVDGKVPINQLPDSILGQVVYQGVWNASTNTPTLPDPTTVQGHYYITEVSGTFNSVFFEVGDWVISNGVTWDKVDNTDAVMSVNGKLGVVVLSSSDVGAVEANTSITGDTKCKITYDSKGLVTAGEDLSSSDIPNLSASKITMGRLNLARLPAGTSGYFLKGDGGSNSPIFSPITVGDISDYTLPNLQQVLSSGNISVDTHINVLKTIDTPSQTVLSGVGLNVAGNTTTDYSETITHGDPDNNYTKITFATPTNPNDIVVPNRSGTLVMDADVPEIQTRNYTTNTSVGTSGQSLANYSILVNTNDVYKVIFAGSCTATSSGSISLRYSSTSIITIPVPTTGISYFEGTLEMYVVGGFIHMMYQLRAGNTNFSIAGQQTAISAGSTMHINLFVTTDVEGGVVLRKRYIERAVRYDV